MKQNLIVTYSNKVKRERTNKIVTDSKIEVNKRNSNYRQKETRTEDIPHCGIAKKEEKWIFSLNNWYFIILGLDHQEKKWIRTTNNKSTINKIGKSFVF